jgi:hypothetical protein
MQYFSLAFSLSWYWWTPVYSQLWQFSGNREASKYGKCGGFLTIVIHVLRLKIKIIEICNKMNIRPAAKCYTSDIANTLKDSLILLCDISTCVHGLCMCVGTDGAVTKLRTASYLNHDVIQNHGLHWTYFHVILYLWNFSNLVEKLECH